MSIFLMGVWDPATKQWCTVAKCGNGHDDKTIEQLNKQLKMNKISKVCRNARFCAIILAFPHGNLPKNAYVLK